MGDGVVYEFESVLFEIVSEHLKQEGYMVNNKGDDDSVSSKKGNLCEGIDTRASR